MVLERGGRFFGDGVYFGLGGTFYTINPKKDALPEIKQDIVVIVDSVINTAKSISKIINVIKTQNPKVEIIIATNVIQEKAVELLKNYPVFTVRVSSNYFVGNNQAEQEGKKGPDTADRLFNLIEQRFI